jgi:formylglycine-generating enzyme required for sulfatase activity
MFLFIVGCWVSNEPKTDGLDDTTDTTDIIDTADTEDTAQVEISVVLGPEPLFNTDMATCNVIGTTNTPQFQWLLGTEDLFHNNHILNLAEGYGAIPGQSLKCTAFDSLSNAELGQDELIIANREPTDIQMETVPSLPFSTDDNVECLATANEPDGQPLTFLFEWNETTTLRNVQGRQLNATDTSAGEEWECTVSVSDGSISVSDTLIILIDETTNCGFGDCDASLELGAGIIIDLKRIPTGIEPLNRYTLTTDFFMMTTEVTQGMFLKLMAYDSRQEQSQDNGEGTNFPAYYSNWHMAADFANTVTQKHNIVNGTNLTECYSCTGNQTDVTCTNTTNPYTCDGFRLPTEAEWEYAARSGTSNDFWTGEGTALGGNPTNNNCSSNVVIQDGVNNPNLSLYVWYCANNFIETTKEVAKKEPNGFGLYDMHGNVLEWTSDYFDSSFPADVSDPWNGVSNTSFVMRSGNYYFTPSNIGASFRSSYAPESRFSDYGFRLVRTIQ